MLSIKNHRFNNQSLVLFFALTTMSLLMALHLHYRSPDFPYSSDSATYIEQARNLLNVGSALSTPFGLNPADKDQTYSTLFPIGYPAILAMGSSFGFDAKDVAVGLGIISTVLLPWLLFFCFRISLGVTNALILAALSVSTPGILMYSPMALSDVFSLTLVIGSIGLSFNSRTALGFILSGLLAGVAYAVRNANLALLIAFAVYFCWLWVFSKEIGRPRIYQQAAGFFIGAATVIGPVFFRNLTLFGVLNPYNMPKSTIGVVSNTQTYIKALFYDTTACKACTSNFIFIPVLILLVLFTVTSIWILIRHKWSDLQETKKRTIVMCSVYVVVGSCIVIAARSRYQWGEIISVRHTLQYIPFLFGLLMSTISISSTESVSKRFKNVQIVLILSLAFSHAFYALFSENSQSKSNESPALLAYKYGQKDLCLKEDNTLLVSNFAYVFRIECGAHVRHLGPVNLDRDPEVKIIIDKNKADRSLISAILTLENQSAKQNIIAGFFPGRHGLDERDFPLQNVDLQKLIDSGWVVVRNDEQALIIKYHKDNAK